MQSVRRRLILNIESYQGQRMLVHKLKNQKKKKNAWGHLNTSSVKNKIAAIDKEGGSCFVVDETIVHKAILFKGIKTRK